MTRQMKDSGVQWIGEIPSNWICCKQKYSITLLNGRAYKESEFEEDGKYKILRVGNLFTNPIWYTSSLELEPNKYCQEGDLLYSWSMSYAPVIWHGEKVIYHYHIWKTVLSEEISKMFAYYYFISLTNALQAEVHETTMGFITMGVMNNAYIAFPSLAEQTSIVNFLDAKCAEIDGLLADLEAEIKTLTEYKKSIIAETVTKGLDPNVELISADLGWIKEIPKQWRLIRWRFVLSLNTLQNNDCRNTNQLQFKYGEIIRKKEQQLDNDVLRIISNYTVVEKDDIMINGLNLNYDFNSFRVGQVREKGIITSAYICLRTTDKGLSRFYMYYLKAMDNCKVFHGMGKGIRLTLSYDELKNLLIPVPPKDEQIAIAAYLDEKCAAIDLSISEKQSQIETLKAYKASLIYEYVTGKKQVI